MPSGSDTNSLGCDVVSPGKNQSDRKSYEQEHNHKAQCPVWQFPRRKNRRPDLNDKSRSNDVSDGDPVDFPPLQLLEEAAHNDRKSLPDAQSFKTWTRLAYVEL